MSLPDNQLDPEDENYCAEHDLFYEDYCPACEEESIERKMEWDEERRNLNL